jgi:hypothetical protein
MTDSITRSRLKLPGFWQHSSFNRMRIRHLPYFGVYQMGAV